MRNERDFPSAGAGQGVGARLPRKEDDRLMRGRGRFVADIRIAGLQDVAFVRSPLAHAWIRGIQVPEQYRASVFTAADLTGVNPIRAVSALFPFKPALDALDAALNDAGDLGGPLLHLAALAAGFGVLGRLALQRFAAT